jgi:NAD(P)-dependent dehydrogenase (short-subunit alcohol dehydrogenase family)
MPDKDWFAQQTAVVTGAASGIGQAICAALLAREPG